MLSSSYCWFAMEIGGGMCVHKDRLSTFTPWSSTDPTTATHPPVGQEYTLTVNVARAESEINREKESPWKGH